MHVGETVSIITLYLSSSEVGRFFIASKKLVSLQRRTAQTATRTVHLLVELLVEHHAGIESMVTTVRVSLSNDSWLF